MLALLKKSSRQQPFQVLRARHLGAFSVGMQVVHETKGWGVVKSIDTEDREVLVDFGVEGYTFPESKLLGGKLQPATSLPRTVGDFKKDMLVSHERNGVGKVVEVDADHAIVLVEFAGLPKPRLYGELSLARGRLQLRSPSEVEVGSESGTT